MTKRYYWIFSIAMIGLIFPYQAHSFTQNEMKDYCQYVGMDLRPNQQNEIFLSGVCLGYISGLTNAQEAQGQIEAESLGTSIAICRPSGTSRQQIVDMALKHMRSHPEDGHKPAGLLIAVFMANFPCKGGK